MRILLVGAGAMGTIIGALIAEAGYDIELADSFQEQVKALNQNGAKLIGNLNKVVPVKAILPKEANGTYDLIISTTKHNTLEESLKEIKPFTTEDTIVLNLQNGLPEEKTKKIYDEKNIFGGSMEFSATFIGPGISELTSDRQTLGITFGSLNGKIDDRILMVKEILSPIGKVEISNNIKGVKWTKLTDNACFSGLPTALGCTVGDILDSNEAMECALYLGKECSEVIKGLEITPVELFNLLPTIEKLGFNPYNAKEKEACMKYWRMVEEPFRDQIASMLQDIKKGKKCEIQNINGEIVRMGNKVGIDTPFNDKVVEIVTKLQDKELSLENAWDNLKEFRMLIPKPSDMR